MSLVFYATFIILFLLYKWLSKKNYYFEEKGIAYSKPHFLFGASRDMLFGKLSMMEMVNQWYKEFPNEKLTGLFEFSTPTYFIRDPKLLKKLTVKDFDSFADHKMFLDENIDPLFGKALFSLQGQKWRDMRSTLSPAFTGSKMRQMFELLNAVGEQAAATIRKQVPNNGIEIMRFKDLAQKFTVDTIATCAYGIEINSFQNPDNDFHKISKTLTNFGDFSTTLKFIGYFLWPKLMALLNVKFFDDRTTSFFKNAIIETMKAREEKGIIRHDMINLLLQAKKGKLTHEKEKEENLKEGFATVEESAVGKAAVKTNWTDDDLTAQCFIFFFAGFDTVSTVMNFMAHELMVNPDCQRKLHAEIDELNERLGGKRVGYEQIQGMKYMDQVVSETLRMWTPTPIIDRLCVKDYVMEFDDKKFTIEKDKNFYIPISGFHRDAKYFPNPDKFDPERFSDENHANIDPDTYLPFGIGPRNCIGSRFALMEIKTIFYYLLLNMDLVVSSKTEVPIKVAKGSQLKADVWVGFKARK